MSWNSSRPTPSEKALTSVLLQSISLFAAMRYRSIFIACLLPAAFSLIWSQDEETRRHLLHELGGPYFISRDKVQAELQLTEEQKQKVQKKLSADLLAAGDLLQKLKAIKGGEREKLMQPSYENLETFLQANLTSVQFQRFQQLELQYDIPGIMLSPAIVAQLHITEDQRQKFMSAVQGMQKEISPLMQKAKSGGNQQEILQQVTRLRLDCQAQVVAMLNETQRSQWEEMTGSPFIIW